MTVIVKKYYSLLILLYLLIPCVLAQTTTLQVVSKKSTHQLKWTKGINLEFNGQYADISIIAWDKKSIEGTTELIAKHTDMATAKRDVRAFSSVFEQRKKTVYVGNQLVFTDINRKPSSTLTAKFTLWVPRNCPITLNNTFGNIEVEGLHQSVAINSRFSKLHLKNIEGKTKLDTSYGTIYGQSLAGQVGITSNRTIIQLEQLEGQYDLQPKHGSITIVEDPNKFYDLDVKGDKADVIFLKSILPKHHFDLTTAFGKITVPSQEAFRYLSDTDSLTKVIYEPENAVSDITVSLSFGNISIK